VCIKLKGFYLFLLLDVELVRSCLVDFFAEAFIFCQILVFLFVPYSCNRVCVEQTARRSGVLAEWLACSPGEREVGG